MKKWYLAFFLFPFAISLVAQLDRGSIIEAKEEFRWGVFAFNQGNYSDAILSFEKSISLDPEDSNTHFWLGLSYYVLGFEAEALIEWKNLLAKGYNSELLTYWINAVEIRRSLLRPFYEGSAWEVLQEVSSTSGFFKNFSRPTVLRPDSEGGFFLVSFGMGGIYHFNANGNQDLRITGGIEPLRRPFDILPVGDRLFISEYGKDRISVYNAKDGTFSYRFGISGIAPGFLLAPQYLAADSKGFIYVSEWGNQRVSKFDREGKYLLSFGRPQENYEGLIDPTGIVVRDNRIFVASKRKKNLDVFDESGNYLTTYSVNLDNIEGLALDNQNRILITAGRKLYAFDPPTQRLTILQDLSKTLSKSLFFGYDANGQLLVADFDKSKVVKMAPIPFLYEGLFVRIARITSNEHPIVRAEIVVEDRYGNPIVGLESPNFILREGDYLIDGSELEYAGFDAPDAGIAFIFDKRKENFQNLTAMKSVMRSLITDLNKRDVRTSFFSSSDMPILEKEGLTTDIQGANLLDKSAWVSSSKLDLTIFQAGGFLSKGPYRRSIVFLTDGEVSSTDFFEHDLSEAIQFLKNNGISFHIIQFGNKPLSEEFALLTKETEGLVIPFSSPEGVLSLSEKIFSQKSGRYLIKYESPNDPEFGYRYVPLVVEVNFNKRSGMAYLGYFAPNSNLNKSKE